MILSLRESVLDPNLHFWGEEVRSRVHSDVCFLVVVVVVVGDIC